jgi:hypothetical protein
METKVIPKDDINEIAFFSQLKGIDVPEDGVK